MVELTKRGKEDHVCDYWECKSCQQMVPEGHLCYIRALDAKDSKGKFIFFDIETTQNEIWQCKDGYEPAKNENCKHCINVLCTVCTMCKNCNHATCGKYQHRANLIIAQKCCLGCMGEPLLQGSKCDSCGTRCNQCNKFNKNDNMYDTPPCLDTCGFRENFNNEWLSGEQLQARDCVIEEKQFVKSPIAQIPSNGYVTDQFSKVPIQWLEWETEKNRKIGFPTFIQHGNNLGEYRLPNTKYRLDGFCEATNTAYEFYGCLWHGCKSVTLKIVTRLKYPEPSNL
ncbi:hypothetical protein KUTeg_001318 [Tegillarca granosa]|uniref:Uncharacterized protein n=1 Tax=Tegillarca granosa TaxID=220873 RepID=A0ABQ9FV38_TEGGR|nr:hypothetical protein KUTeg_001318 [Tegillarca granosa]